MSQQSLTSVPETMPFILHYISNETDPTSTSYDNYDSNMLNISTTSSSSSSSSSSSLSQNTLMASTTSTNPSNPSNMTHHLSSNGLSFTPRKRSQSSVSRSRNTKDLTINVKPFSRPTQSSHMPIPSKSPISPTLTSSSEPIQQKKFIPPPRPASTRNIPLPPRSPRSPALSSPVSQTSSDIPPLPIYSQAHKDRYHIQASPLRTPTFGYERHTKFNTTRRSPGLSPIRHVPDVLDDLSTPPPPPYAPKPPPSHLLIGLSSHESNQKTSKTGPSRRTISPIVPSFHNNNNNLDRQKQLSSVACADKGRATELLGNPKSDLKLNNDSQNLFQSDQYHSLISSPSIINTVENRNFISPSVPMSNNLLMQSPKSWNSVNNIRQPRSRKMSHDEQDYSHLSSDSKSITPVLSIHKVSSNVEDQSQLDTSKLIPSLIEKNHKIQLPSSPLTSTSSSIPLASLKPSTAWLSPKALDTSFSTQSDFDKTAKENRISFVLQSLKSRASIASLPPRISLQGLPDPAIFPRSILISEMFDELLKRALTSDEDGIEPTVQDLENLLFVLEENDLALSALENLNEFKNATISNALHSREHREKKMNSERRQYHEEKELVMVEAEEVKEEEEEEEEEEEVEEMEHPININKNTSAIKSSAPGPIPAKAAMLLGVAPKPEKKTQLKSRPPPISVSPISASFPTQQISPRAIQTTSTNKVMLTSLNGSMPPPPPKDWTYGDAGFKLELSMMESGTQYVIGTHDPITSAPLMGYQNTVHQHRNSLSARSSRSLDASNFEGSIASFHSDSGLDSSVNTDTNHRRHFFTWRHKKLASDGSPSPIRDEFNNETLSSNRNARSIPYKAAYVLGLLNRPSTAMSHEQNETLTTPPSIESIQKDNHKGDGNKEDDNGDVMDRMTNFHTTRRNSDDDRQSLRSVPTPTQSIHYSISDSINIGPTFRGGAIPAKAIAILGVMDSS